MLQLLKNCLLSGDLMPCFERLIECVQTENVADIIKQGPELLELAKSSGLVHLEAALDQIIINKQAKNETELPAIDVEKMKKLLEPIQLPVIKHYFADIIFPRHDETVDLLRNHKRLSELYKETTEQFLVDQNTAGEIVTRCANLLESTFHQQIQELCKTKDSLTKRINQLNEQFAPLKSSVELNQNSRYELEWTEYKLKRMNSAKNDLLKSISFIQHQASHGYLTENSVATEYYELLYRDKIIRYQSTQLASATNPVQKEYKRLLKYMSIVTNIPPVVLDDNLLNISDALENEGYIDFSIARELLTVKSSKHSFTRADSGMSY
eukprot:NODE_216_length_14242_cov_0.417592.p5 type:complete len:324 gc:universal NODE_216_length_14242_cov_0.417592:2385-3356(+)